MRRMNCEIEKMKSYSYVVPNDFRKLYAGVIFDLERINSEIDLKLECVHIHCLRLTPDEHLTPVIASQMLKEQAQIEADDILHELKETSSENNLDVEELAQEPDLIPQKQKYHDLIVSLMGLLIQFKNLSESEVNAVEIQAINEAMEEVKQRLNPSNLSSFQSDIEVHLQYIQTMLSNYGNLQAFLNCSQCRAT